MQLRTKIIIILVGVIVCFLAADSLFQGMILLPSFEKLEQREAVKDLERSRLAITAEVGALAGFCRDWAFWDDTYQFIEDKNPRYIESNLIPQTFIQNELNLIRFYDRAGNLVWGQERDKKGEIITLGGVLEESPCESGAPEAGPVNTNCSKGIVATDLGLMMLVSAPILTSDSKGPVRGSLVMGRLIGAEVMKRLMQTSRTDFRLVPASRAGDLAKTEVLARLKKRKDGSLVEYISDELLWIYSWLKDQEGNRSAIIRVQVLRDITVEGRVAMGYARLSIAALGFVLLTVLFLLLHKVVLRPMAGMTIQALDIAKKKTFEARMDEKRGDEIGALSGAFNRMLEALNQLMLERLRAQEELIQSEKKFRGITNNALDAIIMADLEGKVVLFNPAAERCFDLPAEKALGSDLANLFTPPGSPPGKVVLEFLHGFPEVNSVGAVREFTAFSAKGREFPVEISLSSLVMEKKTNVLAMVRDITERRNTEHYRRRLETQLRHAQRMKALGTLTSGIAHDFNNILQGITGYAQIITEDANAGDEIGGYAAEIEKTSARAADLVQRLLTFSRKVEPELGPLDLNQAAHEAMSLLERIIPKMIRIELETAPTPAIVNADAGQMSQVLLNLGANAKDAMPQGGRIVISVKALELSREQAREYPGLRSGPHFCIEFSDSGHGIPRHVQEDIFDPFFTTRQVGSGTGLGLSIVYGIIKSHSGSIDFTSTENEGTTFRIILPELAPGAQMEEVEMELNEPAPGGTETILVVDDERMIRFVAESMLKKKGYQVLTAENGEQALEIVSAKASEIDLVVLDLGMPGMGGEMALKELKKIKPDQKVLVATGFAKKSVYDRVRESGANAFVAKPYRFDVFLKVVREVLDLMDAGGLATDGAFGNARKAGPDL